MSSKSRMNSNDKNLIKSLFHKYKEIIDNKKTDRLTNVTKDEIWNRITMKFNQKSHAQRTKIQLRKNYKNLKMKLKRNEDKNNTITVENTNNLDVIYVNNSSVSLLTDDADDRLKPSDKTVKCDECNEDFALNLFLLQHKLFRLINYNSDDDYLGVKLVKNEISKRIKISSLQSILGNHDIVYSSDSDCDYEIRTIIQKIPNTSRKTIKTEANESVFVNNGDLVAELIDVNSIVDDDENDLTETVDNEILFNTINKNNVVNDKCNYCELCDNYYKNIISLRAHVSKVHNKFKMKKCTKCDKEFLKLSDLTKHKQVEHTNEYLCNVCGKNVKDTFRLTEHMRVHDNSRPFLCKLCKKTFKYSNSLRLHMEKHENLQKYLCTYGECNKKFNYRSGLAQHIKVMHTPKAYKCHICSKNYTTKNHLQQHLHLHTGERPYKCNFCSKGFRLPTSLKIHIRIHTGERPHECHLCKKTFSKSFNLKVHLKAKNGCAVKLRQEQQKISIDVQENDGNNNEEVEEKEANYDLTKEVNSLLNFV